MSLLTAMGLYSVPSAERRSDKINNIAFQGGVFKKGTALFCRRVLLLFVILFRGQMYQMARILDLGCFRGGECIPNVLF